MRKHLLPHSLCRSVLLVAAGTASKVLAQLEDNSDTGSPTSASIDMIPPEAMLGWASSTTTQSPIPTTPAVSSSNGSLIHMRLALTITHLLLVSLGTVNLLVIFVILVRPYMRSITNVYMISLCLADFIYLANLTLVAATQLNDKSWPFSSFMCTIYHGTETTGKYASVMFVVLLAADRYCAMCKTNWCARYRNYRTAIVISLVAWTAAIVVASPLYAFSHVALMRLPKAQHIHRICIAKWPSSHAARWYITFSSILIFALPLVLILFCYYHILNKLREALKGCKRMRRGTNSKQPYHRVTRLVLWVIVFHVICWSPFWLFNVFSSIFRLRITTQFDRVVVNIIHLFPYVNCALNPLIYAIQAENFRTAFRSLFCPKRGILTRSSGRQQSTMVDGEGRMIGVDGDSRYIGGTGSSLLLANGKESHCGIRDAKLRSSMYVKCPTSSGMNSSFNASSERLLSAGNNLTSTEQAAVKRCSSAHSFHGSPIVLANSKTSSPTPNDLAVKSMSNGGTGLFKAMIPTLSSNDIATSKELIQFNRTPSDRRKGPVNTSNGSKLGLTNRIFSENTKPNNKSNEPLIVENSFILNNATSNEGDVLM
ncbi:7 transmembrane receptor (rhodopsin family) domain-containing protein [Ditylenchus destructor]|nr:7 transmembrane receptor (rhodopsin family) domain-containing protein [Ditylenchus destructor]